ncbi:hypothetical protein BRDCF_p836 [Bacteroidales bacterium CF]|nr:hypothetical protein BRDCF_p836 [Bacteroidales bacterium CF]
MKHIHRKISSSYGKTILIEGNGKIAGATGKIENDLSWRAF